MTLFESKLCDLLRKCEELLTPALIKNEKWQILDDTRMTTVEIPNHAQSIYIAFAMKTEVVKSTSEYVDASSAYYRDSVFRNASHSAGHWGAFESVVVRVLQRAGTVKRSSVVVDYPAAVSASRDLQKLFSQKLVKYHTRARVFGVDLSQKSFELSDGASLHRLTRKERNSRMPAIVPYGFGSNTDFTQLGHSKCEVRLDLTVPVDHSTKGAHFDAHQQASQLAHDVLENVISAILLAKSGRILLGDIEVLGGVPGISSGRLVRADSIPPTNLTVASADIESIKSAQALVAGGSRSDNTLTRSLQRFLLGRKRNDASDRLVDYVVAWESILLTSHGSPIAQEMSYRFALNGASLLSRTRRDISARDANKKFKQSYAVRSKIVHGGSKSEIEKALSAAGFNSIVELCTFLESQYRKSVSYLTAIPRKDRPYLKPGGWEDLIWPST